MVYGNTAIVLMVISVVACVLGVVFVATYCLNKVVDGKAAPSTSFSAHDQVG